jgi:hypothetical protein
MHHTAMLNQFFWAIVLTSATVATHTVYCFYLIRSLRRHPPHQIAHGLQHPQRMFLLVRCVIALLFLHCVETTFWALYYLYDQGLPDFATSLYFSMLSYATIGYGDVVLPGHMRLVGAMEGMVGTMMAGWSVALIVAVLQDSDSRGRQNASSRHPNEHAD